VENAPAGASRIESCCQSKSSHEKAKPSDQSKLERGKSCTKTTASQKIPGVLPSKAKNPVTPGSKTSYQTTSAVSNHNHLQVLFHRWSGHSLAPPGDLSTSLQRLLI
jgi:hypothetical protein